MTGPGTDDLRGFLDRVKKERKSDLLEIERPVSPRHETAAILAKLEERQRSPILFFKQVVGSPFPLVNNVCGSLGRIALALGVPLRDISPRYAAACAQPIAPAVDSRPAPVFANLLRGAEIDLGMLPAMVYHEGDADRPYLTAAIAVARDPDTGHVNLSYHRMMIAGRDHTGIYMEPGKHLDRIWRAWAARGRAMPLAVFIGAHPLWSLGALYSGPLEEYGIIGGLLGAPLALVPCATQPDLAVPSHAELVLEGFVPPDERITEGPFGEFTGYGTGPLETPVFHLTAMAFREQMIFQDIVSGHLEHLMLSVPALEHRTLKDARAASPNVTRVALIAPLTVIVALDKHDDEEPRRVLDALINGDIYTKHAIVVDADVDPGDARAVLAAIALNVQADRAVEIVSDRQGTPLDPSCPTGDGRTAKMTVDATRALRSKRSITKNRIPQAVLDAVDLDAILGRRP
ncbi:MAG: UbiD family decarboxylase [Deltaproteobacteria bacterium]|nr:UbiD family decarboxylase [Deltaproteobacteria bacterium]